MGHDSMCPYPVRSHHCECPFIERVRADERERVVAVVSAARAWVARIIDPPNLWADEVDFALIKAVRALDE